MNPTNLSDVVVTLAGKVVRMTTAAGSGHPSTSLAIGHIVVELLYRQMRFDPANPWENDADRLVLSAGHAVPMVYAAYAELGGVAGSKENPERLSDAALWTLRDQKSVLDGHPNPAEGFPFFDAATGSLGQGLSVAAGLALAARLDKSERRIFVILGDGESREGQIWEAADFIIDHDLRGVVPIVSCNGWGQADRVSNQQSVQRLTDKLIAFGFAVTVVDGHDFSELSSAFRGIAASSQCSVILARTVKGWGVASMQKSNYHGKPVPAAELRSVLEELEQTRKTLPAIITMPRTSTPSQRKHSGSESRPGSIPSFDDALRNGGHEKALQQKKMATRAAFGVALREIGRLDERVVSLDADVSNSTFANQFASTCPSRFFECKIAEQNMISVGVGLSAGGKIPFASSFSKFIARAADQIDMAAISRANLKIVGSHSGVSLAADGPSQMSLSDMAYFRSMTRCDNGSDTPVCRLYQPADAVCAYRCVELMIRVPGPAYLRTHRPDAPFLYPTSEAFDLSGVKQLAEGDRICLASSGYMVHAILAARTRLEAEGVSCAVFDVYCFPSERGRVVQYARRKRIPILVVEDNFIGGLHAELAEEAALQGDVSVAGLTVRRLPKSARTPEEVFHYTGVGLDQILGMARKLISQ